MPERVRITDVSPRDGLQNEAGIIPTGEKVRLVGLLCASGVDEVEVSSFVSARWIPQLGDAEEVFAGLAGAGLPAKRPVFSALVPNERGMESAERVRGATGLLEKVSVFTAASETFCRKNINATIAESIERFGPVAARARSAAGDAMPVRAYVSCVIACPFEGPIAPARVVSVCRSLASLGVDELDLGDTIGAGTPERVGALLEELDREFPIRGGPMAITLHLHDTFGRAAGCVRTGLEMGVRSFDGSVAGLGGCPYASRRLPDGRVERAPGNISTELLVRTVEDAGYETGVNRAALASAGEHARKIVAASRAKAEGGR